MTAEGTTALPPRLLVGPAGARGPGRPPAWQAAWRSLPRRGLAVHVGGAVALVAVTTPLVHDQSSGVLALRVVALLLATAGAFAADEASALLLDAVPTTLGQRVAARWVACAAVVLPVWVAALAVVASRGGRPPLAALTLELAALALVALAVPMALRRWWRVAEPAVIAGPLLLTALIAAAQLPEHLALLAPAVDAPSWRDAHVRWAAIAALFAALLLRAIHEPCRSRFALRT